MGVKDQTIKFIQGLSPTEHEDLRLKFKASKSRHRQQKLAEKKALKKEIEAHHEKNQEKQRKKKGKKQVEVNFDKFVGQCFTEKWEDKEYKEIIAKKDGDGYEVFYNTENQYDIFSCDELKELITSKKIVFCG
uniref:Uncharacterized protein n=1 Tax=Panagrolaimus davidi TaxID=227884 RepID=A0A914PRS8_9BILA